MYKIIMFQYSIKKKNEKSEQVKILKKSKTNQTAKTI